MNPENVLAEVLKLTVMKFFPREPQARAAIVEQLGEMCETEEQVKWLVNRFIKLYDKWTGMGELRALFCAKYKPKDGLEKYSTVYKDGIPSERPPQESPLLLLPPGPAELLGPVSAAPSIATFVRDLAAMKRIEKPGPRPRDLPGVQITDANRITPADISRAIQEARIKRAAEELHPTPAA